MTLTRNTLNSRRVRSTGDLVHGALAALGLVAFVVGVPVALSVVAPVHVPTSWPTWHEVGGAVLRPDDGSLLLGLLALVAWVAWASFTLSVVVEVVAGIRRLPSPSIPMLGLSQRAAATLVTTAGLLLATSWLPLGPAATVSASAAPFDGAVDRAAALTTHLGDTPSATPPSARTRQLVGLTAIESAHGSHSASITAARVGAEADVHPVVVAERGDTLWSLAERHLGSGHRYTEIRDLNVGRPQSDGRTLTDTHWIYPGWHLRLPLDATAVPVDTATQTTSAIGDKVAGSETVVEVEHGDTLWRIAKEDLGSGARYTEIFALNAGAPQRDGSSLSNPNLIQPGWDLKLPTVAEGAAASAPPVDRAVDAHPQLAPIPVTPTVRQPPRTELVLPSGAPSHPLAQAPATPGTVDDGADDESTGFPVSRLFLGLTGLAAAGAIGELSRRRHLQHRIRRVGERIPLPEPGSPVDDAERTLRSAAIPLSIAQIKGALLNLASRCYTAERDLPRVGIVLLSEHTLELHLVDDNADAVDPFTMTDSRTWTATTESIAADPNIDDDPDRPEPYPALVTLGHTDEATVLCNLEAAGTVAVRGDPDIAEDVVRAIVAELTTSDLTGRIGLIAGAEFAGLAGASDTARLQIAAQPEVRQAQRADRPRAVAAALAASGEEDTLQARSDRTAEDTWLPVVYVETDDRDAVHQDCAPWSGSVLIATGATSSGWSLAVEQNRLAVLEPLGVRLYPQRLTVEDLGQLTNLLSLAQSEEAHQAGGDASIPEPSSVEDDIIDALSALPTPASTSPEPVTVNERAAGSLRINVLGRIQIDGIPGPDARLTKRATELLVYLALHGSATGPELDEALWHGRRVDSQTRNSLVYRTRQHVGADNLPIVDSNGLYRIGPGVTNDWDDFQALARAGLAVGPGGAHTLRSALDLVRDRPFLGIAGANYTWAEHDIQQMISTIADVAHVRSQLLLNAGDHRGALEAATRGLLAEPCSELLYADAIAGAEARRDLAEADRLRLRLQALLGDLDPDYAPA